MTTTQIRLSANGNDFISDIAGGIIGLQFEKDGDTLRTFCVNFSNFDLANRIATNNFVQQIQKGNGDWATIGSFRETVSDVSGFISTDPSTFGNKVTQPFEEDGITLLPNVSTEAQFFVDTLIKNKYGITIDIATFIYVTIQRVEELT